MSEWHERVMDELIQLENKAEALRNALSDTDMAGKLSSTQYGLLQIQLPLMDGYAGVLRLRLRDAGIDIASPS